MKEEIASTGVLEELIRIMSSAEYEKLLWTCSRLLKVLSVNGKAKVTLVQTSAMQILGGLLTQQPTPMNKSIVSNCLWTLRFFDSLCVFFSFNDVCSLLHKEACDRSVMRSAHYFAKSHI